MIGDAISHTVLLGIIGAFLVSHSLDSFYMLIGATIVGMLTAFFVQLLHQSGVQSDAAIGVVFTALFALGVILVSMLASEVHIDLEHVLYGEIAYVPWDTLIINGMDLGPRAVWMMGGVFLFVVLILSLFYKELKMSTFDPLLAATLGIPVLLIHYLLMGLVSLTTVAAFENVGAILVVAMLIVPGATAYLLTDRLAVMLVLSVIVGILSAILGYWLAVLLDASIAGAMTTVAGILFAIAFLFSPSHGLVIKQLKQKRV